MSLSNVPNGTLQGFPFPNQRVSDREKEKPEWYANCCDWIIAQGLASKDIDETEQLYQVLKGYIPDEFYKKTLNPYNTTKINETRFPATMRNYDFIKGVIRRYIGEYAKNAHEFTVTAKNPEVILNKNLKLRQEIMAIVQTEIAAKIQEAYAQFVQQGNDPNQFNPQEHINIEEYIKEFNENYIDDISAQGQDILNVIQSITDDQLLYIRAYFDFVSFGECYTYTDIDGTQLIKRNVSPRDAFPIPNDSMFVEDHDMFAERMKMTYQQIIDNFDMYFDDKQREYLNNYYAKNSIATPAENYYNAYQSYFPELCGRFSQKDREFFKTQPVMMRDVNADLYDVWHVVWRGEKRYAVVTYVNESGLITTRLENDNYELKPEDGDISIDYIYEPQVYESVRIGVRNEAIYPYKARAISVNRNGKLPYNGICELLPGFGKFSIIREMLPYQVFYNIVAYHREMIIAKTKLNVLMIAKSLLGTKPSETIYKMIADGVLYIDDDNDQGMIRAQQVRMISASNSDYISQLGSLLVEIEQQAKNQVDMNIQRYGEIANSAGKAVTEEAIARGSIGSVIVEYIMDCVRERDYNRDMDYSKIAWIDGLNTSLRGNNKELKYLSLDVNKHLYADYCIQAKNSAKELDKLQQLKSYAFSAAQNGQDDIAIAAIMGDNVSAIKELIDKYKNIQRQHELQLQQMEQQTEQAKQQFELQKIAAQGEQDRATKELEAYLDAEIELIRADANYLSYNPDLEESDKNAAQQRLEESRKDIEQQKISLQREIAYLDSYNKDKDRQVKLKDIDTRLKIARENRNKYDFKRSKSKSKK